MRCLVHSLGNLGELRATDAVSELVHVRHDHVFRSVPDGFTKRGVSLCISTVRRGQISLLFIDLGHQSDRGAVPDQILFGHGHLGDLDAAVEGSPGPARAGQQAGLGDQRRHVEAVQPSFKGPIPGDL